MKRRLLVFIAAGISAQFPAAQQPGFSPAPGSPIAVGSQPADIAPGDFNGDRKLDIVVANSGSGSVTLLFGNGNGGFVPAPASPFATGASSHLVESGDVNRDGIPDLVLTGHDTHGVAVLVGDGKGNFKPVPGSPFPALSGGTPHNHGLLLADLNGDGKVDAATSNYGDHSVSVLLGRGDGTFAPSSGSPFRVGRGPYHLALGKLNEDQHLDIVTPNVSDNTVTVLLGDGKGNFSPAPDSPYRVEYRPYYAAIGDVNGDSNSDIVTTHDDISMMSILLGDGRGHFKQAPNSPLDLRRRGYKLVLVDLNRDKNTDVVVTTYPRFITVLLGDGEGGLEPATDSPFLVGAGPNGAVTGDFNADGKLDIATSNFESNNITILLAR